MVLGGTGSRECGIGQYLMILGQYRSVLVIVCGTGLAWNGTGSYMMVLGQYGAILVGNWWYWISIGRYWLIYTNTKSV